MPSKVSARVAMLDYVERGVFPEQPGFEEIGATVSIHPILAQNRSVLSNVMVTS